MIKASNLMRWIVTILCVSLGHIMLNAQIDLERALKANYTFDNCDGTDASGNNSTATLHGTQCQCGASGQSLYFNGKDDFVELGGNVNEYFKANNFTISFYFRPATSSPNTVLMAKYNDCADDTGWIMRYGNGSVAVQLNGNGGVENKLNVKLKGKTCWTHLALVRKGTAIELYENGELIGDHDNLLRNADIESTSPLTLGKGQCPSSLDKPFQGNIDELRIYNQPLNSLQIQKLLLPVDVIMTKDTVVARGDSFIPLMSHTCATDIEWLPSDVVSDRNELRPVVTVTETTTLQAKFNYSSCETFDQIQIRVVDSDDIDCESIPMPRAFTPNGDGLNDTYGITIPGAFDRMISFEIFNNWNELIFRTENASVSWDGTFKGKKLNPGGFLFKIRYECAGNEYIKTGEFLLFN